jgi:pyruvate,water dikinase
LTRTYRRALKYQLLREQIGTAYTLGYGLFRNAFRELGKRLESQGIIDLQDDVMFLTWKEIEEHFKDAKPERNYQALVASRKQELEESKNIQPPPVIYGEKPVFIHTHSNDDTLIGTPTSRGVYTGPARVVRGLGDMNRVCEGDVLVVPYSDVSWIPLYAKAGAVVSESGGILSHSSIIAREYGIPAVVAVPRACQIPEDTVLIVDGNNGKVIALNSPGDTKSQNQ